MTSSHIFIHHDVLLRESCARAWLMMRLRKSRTAGITTAPIAMTSPTAKAPSGQIIALAVD